jgi:hypothetical protein
LLDPLGWQMLTELPPVWSWQIGGNEWEDVGEHDAEG